MINLINYIEDKWDNNYHYISQDIAREVASFELNFRAFSNHNDTNISKEIIEDMMLLTHMNEKDEIFIAASIFDGNDVFVSLDRPASDFQVIPNSGVYIYLPIIEEKEENGNKVVKEIGNYLRFKIGYTKVNNKKELYYIDTNKFTENYNNEYIADIFKRENEYLITTTNNNLYLIDENFNKIKDLKNTIEEVITYDKEKQDLEYSVFSNDIIGIRVLDKGVNNLLEDNTISTYLFSITKNYILNEFHGKFTINKIFNLDPSNYHDNSYIWLTEAKFTLSSDIKEKLDKDPSYISSLVEENASKFVSGLAPLVLVDKSKENKYTPINEHINDIGGYIEGMDLFYRVFKREDGKYLYAFYYAKEGEIYHDVVLSEILISSIYANPESGVITFTTRHNENFQSIVSYIKDYGSTNKYSKIILKANSVNFEERMKDVKKYIDLINADEELANDEIANIYKIKDIYEWNEEKINQIVSIHYADMTTSELYGNTKKLSYGKYANILTEDFLSGGSTIYKRIKKEGSIEDFYNEKEKQLLDDLEKMK